jgi:hypothetical protein
MLIPIVVGKLVPSSPPLTSLTAWYKADAGVTKDGSNIVSQWDDQSGNANHLNSVGGAPLWVSGLKNSLPGIRFDGTDDIISKTALAVSQPYHLFVVLNQVSWGGDEIISGSAVATILPLQQNGSSPAMRAILGASSITVSPALSVGTFGIIGILANGASSKVKTNNNSDATGTLGTGALARLDIGGNATDASFANVEFCEILLYSAEQSATNLVNVLAYLNGRYSIY